MKPLRFPGLGVTSAGESSIRVYSRRIREMVAKNRNAPETGADEKGPNAERRRHRDGGT